jgi:hypothetical protein
MTITMSMTMTKKTMYKIGPVILAIVLGDITWCTANVCNLDPPPPLKIADVLCGQPLGSKFITAASK